MTDDEPTTTDTDDTADGPEGARPVELAGGLAELERVVQPAAGMPTLPSPAEWQTIVGMANAMARSALVPDKLRGKPDDVALVLWKARDLRIPGSYALDHLHVIDGRVGMAAEVMGALILANGHELWTSDANDDVQATVYARRRDDPERRVRSVTWTVDMAVTAKLVIRCADGDSDSVGGYKRAPNRSTGWVHYRPAMLHARALSQLGRWHFPDLLAGIYSTEELADGFDTIDVDATEVDASDYYAPSQDPEARPISATAVTSWQRRIATVRQSDPAVVAWLASACRDAGLVLVRGDQPVLRREQVADFSALVEEAEAFARDNPPNTLADAVLSWLAWWRPWLEGPSAGPSAARTPDAAPSTHVDWQAVDSDAHRPESGDVDEPPPGEPGGLFDPDDPGRPFE